MLGKHRKKIIALVTLLGVTIYIFWSGFSVPLPVDPNYDTIEESRGDKIGATANIVSMAPVMRPTDYASAAHFKKRLVHYFEFANDNGWFTENTIVLLPAHIGTPLLMTGQKSRVYSAPNIGKILPMLMIEHPFEFAKNYFVFDAEKPWLAATARTRSKRAAEIYRLVFSSLAQNYKVTIVAGSIVLMTPGISPDGLTYGHGPLFHTSFVFGPDGTAQLDAVRQVSPSPLEASIVKASLPEFLPIFNQGNFQFAVAIGDDETNPAVLEHFQQAGVDLVLSPSFLTRINSKETDIIMPNDDTVSVFSSSMGIEGWGVTGNASVSYQYKKQIGSSTTGINPAIIDNTWLHFDE
jgi:hypothetical protein